MSRHVVLDLDECLVKAFTEDKAWSVYDDIMSKHELFHLRERTFIIKPYKESAFWGVKRPYLKQFLLFLFTYFDKVCVWSAGSRDYVHSIVKEIFRDVPQPHLIMTRDDVGGNIDVDYWKPLSKYYHKMKSANGSNTLFVDNKGDNFRNDMDNGIEIQDYDPMPTIQSISNEDCKLLNLVKFIKNMDKKDDVRSINKERIFNRKVGSINEIGDVTYYRIYRRR